MSFKNRGRKKEIVGKAMDEISNAPEYRWYKGKWMLSKDVPLPSDRKVRP